MSCRIDTTSLIAGACVIGNRGLGVLASAVPSTGEAGAAYLYNDLNLPTDAGKEVMGLLLTVPSAGIFAANEDSSFTLTGAPDGVYTFSYRLFVDGVDGGTASSTITIGSGPVDLPPVITGPSGATGSTSAVSIVENSTVVHPFTANETVAWSISGGADAVLFTIGVGGVLSFVTAPNFEAPTDADLNNVYVVTVQATDLATNISTQTVSVTVTNVAESVPMVFTGPIPNKSGVVGTVFDWAGPELATYFSSGTSPYTFAVFSGVLPTGLTIDSGTGAISGTPSVAGAQNIIVRATDAAAQTASTNVFTITITDAGGGGGGGSTPLEVVRLSSRIAAVALSLSGMLGSTYAGKVYVGDVGTVIELETGSSLTGAAVSIKALRPDGTEVEWIGTIAGTSIQYVLQAGNVSQIGSWALQAKVVTSSGTWLGETATMSVYGQFG